MQWIINKLKIFNQEQSKSSRLWLLKTLGNTKFYYEKSNLISKRGCYYVAYVIYRKQK